MKGRVFSLTALLLVLVGCSANPSADTKGLSGSESAPLVGEPVVVSESVEVSVAKPLIDGAEAERILRVLELLDSADRALEEKRLAEPRGNSAVDFYQQVLLLQPGFEEAEQGLAAIVDRYVDWSDAAMRQGRLDQARRYLIRARLADSASPSIAAAATRLRKLAETVKVEDDAGYTRISPRELRVKSSDLKLVLGQLADQIRAEDARVIIEAPTDAQGRWIYQQLNDRHEEFRVRANLKLDPQPGIRLLY